MYNHKRDYVEKYFLYKINAGIAHQSRHTVEVEHQGTVPSYLISYGTRTWKKGASKEQIY